MIKHPRIGMDRYIASEWMELAACVRRGDVQVHEMDERLQAEIAGVEVRKKTIGILNRMWFPTDAAGQAVAAEAAHIALDGAGPRSAAFEAVAIGAYPYFRQVLEHVGRLMRLQDECQAGEVHRRMFELHGKRTTIDQATSYAFKTMVAWRILARTERGSLVRGIPMKLTPEARRLLDEAANRSRSSVSRLSDEDPLLFAFS